MVEKVSGVVMNTAHPVDGKTTQAKKLCKEPKDSLESKALESKDKSYVGQFLDWLQDAFSSLCCSCTKLLRTLSDWIFRSQEKPSEKVGDFGPNPFT